MVGDCQTIPPSTYIQCISELALHPKKLTTAKYSPTDLQITMPATTSKENYNIAAYTHPVTV